MGTRSFVVPAMAALALLFPLAAYCQQPGGTTSYIIGTIAGNGYSGDNGPAISAQLANPSGLAFDSLGNLYIAESSSGVGNHRIRKITPQGIITTVAGNGIRGFSGDGGPAIAAQLNSPRGLAADKLGNLYIADSGNLRVRRVSPAGLIYTVAGGAPWTSACVAYPCLATAVQLDSYLFNRKQEYFNKVQAASRS